jgi:hypothetical protein
MTDNNITARLRAWSADESTWDLLTEGVREIDRLRAALGKIVENEDQYSMVWAAEIARAALGEATDDAAP